MAQRQVQIEERKLETASQREERESHLLGVESSIRRACEKAATVADIPQQFKESLTEIFSGESWIERAVESFLETFTKDRSFYERLWTIYHKNATKR